MGSPASKLLLMFDGIRSGRYGINKLADHLFSFIDDESYSIMPTLSRRIYELSTHKVSLPSQIIEQEVVGRYDSYLIKRTIDRKIAQEVLKQTGVEIVIPPGDSHRNDFLIGRGLGSGGVICLGQAKKDSRYVGIKITQGEKEVTKEVALHKALQKLNVSNVLPILDQQVVPQANGEVVLYQVLEFAGLGSTEKLKHLLQQHADPVFREQLLFCLAEGLLKGLYDMHQVGFCHLDMKPDNLVVRQDAGVFLIDFGCSANKTTIAARRETGDNYYFSPERWLAENTNFSDNCDGIAIDAWAAGLTLLELANKVEYPFMNMGNYYQGPHLHQVQKRLSNYVATIMATIPVLQNPAPDGYWSLVLGLLNFDPKNRLSPKLALQHPWYKKMEAASKNWRKTTNEHLREMVQALQQENRRKVTVARTHQRLEFSPQEIPLPHFTDFVERQALQETIAKRLVLDCSTGSVVTTLQGMGGVGKTQLMNYMVHRKEIQEHFGKVLWFRSAESVNSIESQCFILAEELGLIDKNAQVRDAIEKLHQHLATHANRSGKPWLLVFDNVEEINSIATYIPKKGGHVLMTTRSLSAKNAIVVDVMSKPEALSLASGLLQKQDPQLEKLCLALGNLPLGIVQACAYLRNHPDVSIPAYIEQLEKASKLLDTDERVFGKKLSSSMQGVWQISLNAVARTQAKALEELDRLAYLPPDLIPAGIIKNLCNAEAIAVLHKYALLQINAKGEFAMHRLLQLATRAKHTKEQSQKFLCLIMKVVNSVYDFHPPSVLLRQVNRTLLQTGEVLCTHVGKMDVSSPELRRIYCHTLRWLGHLKGKMGQTSEWRKILEKAYQLAQACYQQEEESMAILLNDLGLSSVALRDYTAAIPYYNAALKGAERSEHLLANIYNNLAFALRSTGDPKAAKVCYKKSRDLNCKIYGPFHPNVGKNLYDLGIVCGLLKEEQESAQYYEEALLVDEKLFAEQDPKQAADKRRRMGELWLNLKENKRAAECFQLAHAFALKANLKADDPFMSKLQALMDRASGKKQDQVKKNDFQDKKDEVTEAQGQGGSPQQKGKAPKNPPSADPKFNRRDKCSLM